MSKGPQVTQEGSLKKSDDIIMFKTPTVEYEGLFLTALCKTEHAMMFVGCSANHVLT